MVPATQGQPGSPEKEKFYWVFCRFQRAGLVAGKGHHGEPQPDQFTGSASTLSHGDPCSAAQPGLPRRYAQLTVQSRPGFLSCRGPESTRPWDRQAQAREDKGALPCKWALTSGTAFYQPHFLPSSSSPPAVKQLLRSRGWLFRLLL